MGPGGVTTFQCHHPETPALMAWTCATNNLPANSTSRTIWRTWVGVEKSREVTSLWHVPQYERNLFRTATC